MYTKTRENSLKFNDESWFNCICEWNVEPPASFREILGDFPETILSKKTSCSLYVSRGGRYTAVT